MTDSDTRTWLLIVAAAVVLRAALMPLLSEQLHDHIHIASPIGGYRRVKEGLFLLEQGLSPYAGDVFHQPPLVILAFWPLRNLPFAVNAAIFIFRDVLTAYYLRIIASYYKSYNERFKDPPSVLLNLPNVVAAAFLFNPLTLLSCVGLSGAGFTHCACAAAIAYAVKGRMFLSTWGLAVAVYLEIYPFVLISPICLLLRESTMTFPILKLRLPLNHKILRSASNQDKNDKATVASASASASDVDVDADAEMDPDMAREQELERRDAEQCISNELMRVGARVHLLAKLTHKDNPDWTNKDKVKFLLYPFLCFFGWLACLVLLSYQVSKSWSFIEKSYGFMFLVPNLTPNIGVFWYMFTEVFDQFHLFFLFVFQANIVWYTPSLTIRFKNQPAFIAAALMGVIGIFKSYPVVSDTAFMMCMLLTNLHLLIPKYRKLYPVFYLLCQSVVTTLMMWFLWINMASGNANFFYFQALLFLFCSGFTLVEAMSSVRQLQICESLL